MASNSETMDDADEDTTDFIQKAENPAAQTTICGEEHPADQINSHLFPSVPALPLGKCEEKVWNFKDVVTKIVRLQTHCRRFTERDEWKDFTPVSTY